MLSDNNNKSVMFRTNDVIKHSMHNNKSIYEMIVPILYTVKDRSGHFKRYNNGEFYGLSLKSNDNAQYKQTYLYVHPSRYERISDNLAKVCVIGQDAQIENINKSTLVKSVNDAYFNERKTDDKGVILNNNIDKQKSIDGSLHADKTEIKSVKSEAPKIVKVLPTYRTLDAFRIDEVKHNYETRAQLAIYNTYIKDYNKLVDKAAQYKLDISENVYEVPEQTDGKTLNYLDMTSDLRMKRDAIFLQVRDYAVSHGCLNEVPDIGTHNTHKLDSVSKLSYRDITNAFNKERGINFNETSCEYDGKRFRTSLSGYGFSKREQQQLAAGETIILSEVANASNQGFNHLVVRLEELPEKHMLREQGYTHGVVTDESIDLMCNKFYDASHNEKYRLHKSEFDCLRIQIDTHDKLYADKIKKNVASLKKSNDNENQKAKQLNRVRSAAALSNADNGRTEGSVMYGYRNGKPINYYVKKIYDVGSRSNAVMTKFRNPDLLKMTKERNLMLPASNHGNEVYGFETLYDEQEFMSRSKSESKFIKKIDKVIDEYVTEYGASSEIVSKLKKQRDNIVENCADTKLEESLRRQPTTDDKMKEQYIVNKWEEHVIKTYNDIHKDDNFVDTERKERYDVHMARLKVAQALRARTAGEDVSVEDAMQDYMNMK